MKKTIVLLSIGLCGFVYAQNDGWFIPSQSNCSHNDGMMDKEGCSAPWDNAKRICSDGGGRLPSYNDYRGLIGECGGDPDNSNAKNDQYRGCTEKKVLNLDDIGHQRTLI